MTLIVGISAFYFNLYTKPPDPAPERLSLLFFAPAAIIISLLGVLTYIGTRYSAVWIIYMRFL